MGAKHGQLEVLQWTRNNEYIWDSYTCALPSAGLLKLRVDYDDKVAIWNQTHAIALLDAIS